jgi:hypothetical protein
MDAPQSKKGSWLHRLLDRLARGTVEDVPEEISACEFECRRLECREGEWDRCPRRLRRFDSDTE